MRRGAAKGATERETNTAKESAKGAKGANEGSGRLTFGPKTFSTKSSWYGLIVKGGSRSAWGKKPPSSQRSSNCDADGEVDTNDGMSSGERERRERRKGRKNRRRFLSRARLFEG